jgi:cyanate permease
MRVSALLTIAGIIALFCGVGFLLWPFFLAYAVGLTFVCLHGIVAHFVWGEQFGDLISMMASSGYPPAGSPPWQNVLSWPLHKLKYFGLFSIAFGVYLTVERIQEYLGGKPF